MIENFCVLGYQDSPFSVESDWFTGRASVRTFALEELLGTKVRALYQRKKGRDLFDLWYALTFCDCVPEQIVTCFGKYMEHAGQRIKRTEMIRNVEEKLSDSRFLNDIAPLIRSGLEYDPATAFKLVSERLISLIPD